MDRIAPWFEQNQVFYPWRKDRTPYSVWVSEVMLQQTRAEVVIKYYLKWMESFPTIEKLASATLEEVIAHWEGLGYYSRARNLHRGAIQVLEKYGGELPSSVEELLKIKGIGPYTAGAIASFGFGIDTPFVDGNIARVIARYTGYEECIQKNGKILQEMTKRYLPNGKGPSFMEGLIELGQKVCKKKPECEQCPLKFECAAYQLNKQDQIPLRSIKIRIESIQRQVAILTCNHKILLRKTPKGEIMADLWEFPYRQVEGEAKLDDLTKMFTMEIELEMRLKNVVHHFTKYKATLLPYLFSCKEEKLITGYKWVSINEAKRLPFSSGHKKIFQALVQAL